MNFKEFLATHPVFRVDELSQTGEKVNRWTLKAALAHHRKQGHIIPVRRGLYATVPQGASPETYPVDPYILASRMADDAVLAYHTALEVHGKAHSVFEHFKYLTSRATRTVEFRSHKYEAVRPPAALRASNNVHFDVRTVDRSGVAVKVTSLERTLVDILDRPDIAGGWEEIWQSLESVEFFDLDKVIQYALLLDNATTAAKVGYYLEQHRETLMVEDVHLKPLRKCRPKRPHYMDRESRGKGRLASEWNLIVPNLVVQRSWEEAR